MAIEAHPVAAVDPSAVVDPGSVSEPAAAARPRLWRERDEPRAITERARWIALRDKLPEGSKAIFGENVFAASDDGAIAFWCDAARSGNLTLWIGVRMDEGAAENPPDGTIRRGAVMRFDPQSCALPDAAPEIVHVALRGIPGITGTWGRMEQFDGHLAGQAPDTAASGGGPASAWLICYEAFLVWSWVETLKPTDQSPDTRPIIVLSNDGAFGNLPVGRLRRKVADAMAGLTGRTVLHAETGRTILVNGGFSRRNSNGGFSRRNSNGGFPRRANGGSFAATRQTSG